MCPQYLMDRRSTQSRDRRGFQRSLHFSCKSLGFMISLLVNMMAHMAAGSLAWPVGYTLLLRDG